MLCKNCPYIVWFGDYALNYCDVTKDKVEPTQRCNCEERRHMAKHMEIPCRIGDNVWAIRYYHNIKKAVCGKVSEMYFVGPEMRLCIVVHGVSRGYWGNTIFGSESEALEAMGRENMA